MNATLINKMVLFFNDGLVLYSKACYFTKKNSVSIDEIEMYYNILCSNEIIPENINRKNHKMCCLYYLAKDNPDYIELFTDKYLRELEFDRIEKNDENLIMIFNVIDFDKTYFKSDLNTYRYLHTLLKVFVNYETCLRNFIVYEYYRCYLKLKLGDVESANKVFLEIKAEEFKKEDFFLNYIKLMTNILKVKIYQVTENLTTNDLKEKIVFLNSFIVDLNDIDRILALKLYLELFDSYLENKEYLKCFQILIDIEKISDKYLLQKLSDLYLAVVSRIGYIGILLNKKDYIQNAINKIKSVLEIKEDINDRKTLKLRLAFKFYLAILEIMSTQNAKNDLKELKNKFQNDFFPVVGEDDSENDIVTKRNKNSIIINLKILDNINKHIYEASKSIMNEVYSDLNNNNNINTSNFILFLSSFHDKIYRYSELYIKVNSFIKKDYYQSKIKEYFNLAYKIIKQYIDDPFFQTHFAKILIIDIIYAYGNILLIENGTEALKKIIDDINIYNDNNLKNKLNIDKKIPNFYLWLKLKGDFYLKLSAFEAAIYEYEEALKLLEPNNPHIPFILFNCGSAYYFKKNYKKAIGYLNLSINSYQNLKKKDNYFGIIPDSKTINKKIEKTRYLIAMLSKLE